MSIRDPKIRLVYRLVCLFVSIALVDVRRPSLGLGSGLHEGGES